MASLDRITRRDNINDPTFTADNQLIFRANFTSDVSNVTADDFDITGVTGATIISIASVNQNDAQYDIVIEVPNLPAFTGTIGLTPSNAWDIIDAGDNSAVPTNVGRNQTYELVGTGNPDTTAPSITSIARQTPGNATTDADTLTFRVTFDEDVQNVDANDFVINGNTTATISGVTQVNGSVYDIVVSGGNLATFNGAVGLDLAVGQNIADIAGNTLPNGEPAIDEVYTVDNSLVPSLTSIERLTPATATTNSDTLVFQVTFSEDVQGIDATDFVVNGGSTASVTGVVAVNNSSSIYNITVSGGDLASFNGPVRLALAANQNITNLSNVAVPVAAPTGTNEIYTVSNETVPPTLLSIERLTPGTAITSDNTLVFQATFDEGVRNVDVTDFSINGNTTASITNVTAVNDRVYNITVSGGNLASFNGSVGIDLADTQNITDLVGNALPDSEPAKDESYTVSNTQGASSKLTVIAGNLLEITELGIAQSLNLTISSSVNVSVETIRIFTTDAKGKNRKQLGSFSVLEGSVLPVEYTPGFSLTKSEIATGTFFQFEVEEIDLKTNTTVIRTATITSVSATEVSLDFGNNTKLTTTLTNEVSVTNLLLNDAAAIDLTGLTGQSEVSFTVYREARLDNTIGFYVTDFADGRIIIDELTRATISPGEEGYKEAALAKQLNVQLTGENDKVTTFEATITNGVFLGTYVVIDGVDPSAGEVFFSHQGSGSFDQIRQAGINSFGVEDIIGGGDQDFNDMVIAFEVRAATA
ncbi:hypothetical protein U2F10_23550 [Leptothoe sp. EHU-05/26/07-4]